MKLKEIMEEIKDEKKHVKKFEEFIAPSGNFLVSFVLKKNDLSEDDILNEDYNHSEVKNYLKSINSLYLIRTTWIVKTKNINDIISHLTKNLLDEDESLVVVKIDKGSNTFINTRLSIKEINKFLASN